MNLLIVNLYFVHHVHFKNYVKFKNNSYNHDFKELCEESDEIYLNIRNEEEMQDAITFAEIDGVHSGLV